MKVLLVHNFYQSSAPSGEDVVFKNEVDLLKRSGIEVVTYDEYNDYISPETNKLTVAINSIWSKNTYKKITSLIKKERPDVAHFHNIWYLISPSAYYACKDNGVSVVQTMHNFRMFCANGLLMRKGKVCEVCIGRTPWRSVVYGCFRGSKVYTVPVAIAETFHRIRGTWMDAIDAYIALTEFGKKKIIECGLPEEKIYIKPNFLADPPVPRYLDDGYAVFLGRLSPEKGVATLLDALKLMHAAERLRLPFKIAGEGPLRSELEHKVAKEQIQNVEFLGKRSFDECMRLLGRSKFMILPAVCYENFPMAIREAFACGKPVIASRLGAMAEIVEDGRTGLLFEPGNAEDFARKIKWMLDNEDACIQMGRNARAEFEAKYTAERNYKILMNIYQNTIESNRKV